MLTLSSPLRRLGVGTYLLLYMELLLNSRKTSHKVIIDK